LGIEVVKTSKAYAFADAKHVALFLQVPVTQASPVTEILDFNTSFC